MDNVFDINEEEDDFLCLDEFPDNCTVLVPKPTTRKLFVYSEWECLLERVTLDEHVAYRNMRLKRVKSDEPNS